MCFKLRQISLDRSFNAACMNHRVHKALERETSVTRDPANTAPFLVNCCGIRPRHTAGGMQTRDLTDLPPFP